MYLTLVKIQYYTEDEILMKFFLVAGVVVVPIASGIIVLDLLSLPNGYYS